MNNSFRYFTYFYKYLGYRLLVTFVISLAVGFLDGIGLALFIPLLRRVAGDPETTAPGDDRISGFVLEYLQVPASLTNILLLILFFFTLKGLAKFLEGYIRVKYQQFFMRKIRISNIDLLNQYDYRNFVQADVGRIQNTFTGEVGKVNSAFRFYFKAYQYAVLVLVYVIMAFMTDPYFSLMVVTGGILTNFLFKFLYNRTKYFSRRLTSENHLFQSLLIQKVAFFKYLKTTGLNVPYGDKLKRNVFSLERLQKRIGLIDSLLAALREPIVVLIIVLAIYLQVTFFDQGMGLIILCLLLLYRALTFFMAAQEQWNFFLGVSGSLENMEQFTNELIAGKEPTGKKSYTGLQDRLELQEVTFQYGKRKVLHAVNLEILKNETLAIVGESGSGKTTLMNILSGLLQPSNGRYLIDGRNVGQMKRSTLGRHIGFVSQEVCIFNDNIFNNVTFWGERNPENLGKFNRAIQQAAIADFVNGLPAKDQTLLGNNGINLSGGQKQRLSIARELYKQVDLLLMDEATSSLDGETESLIQQNMDQLKGKLTIVVIAHRLATIRSADKIVVLKEGRVKAVGSYEQLLADSVDFQEMIAFQNL